MTIKKQQKQMLNYSRNLKTARNALKKQSKKQRNLQKRKKNSSKKTTKFLRITRNWKKNVNH